MPSSCGTGGTRLATTSPHRRGRQLYWPGALFRVQRKPGLEAAGTPSGRSWEADGEDIKTIQEPLRHSNYEVTADVYAQAMTKAKREAQTRVVRMILPEKVTKNVS